MMPRHVLSAGFCMLLVSCLYDPFDSALSTLPWSSLESEHFVYHFLETDPQAPARRWKIRMPDGTTYDPAGRTETESVRAYLNLYEFWYGVLSNLWERSPSEKIAVYEYSSEEQKLRYTGGSGSAFVDYEKPGGSKAAIHSSIFPVIAHELVHIFQSRNGLAPIFLMEGMADALAPTFFIPDETGTTLVSLPAVPVPGFPNPVVPYTYSYFFSKKAAYGLPTHRLAAMKLGLLSDPAFPLEPWEKGTDILPGQILSWANVMTRDTQFVYIYGCSFVQYLIGTYGLEKILLLYAAASPAGFAGKTLPAVFRETYGKELSVLEEDWKRFLEESADDLLGMEAYPFPVIETEKAS